MNFLIVLEWRHVHAQPCPRKELPPFEEVKEMAERLHCTRASVWALMPEGTLREVYNWEKISADT